MATTTLLLNTTPGLGSDYRVECYTKNTDILVDSFDGVEFTSNKGRVSFSIVDLPTETYDIRVRTIATNGTLGNGVLAHVNEAGRIEEPAGVQSSTLVINATSPTLQTIDASGKLSIHRGDYTTFDLTLGSLAGRTGKKLIFTIKPKKGDLDDDSDAYLQINEVNGVVILNGVSTGFTASDGSITVLNEATGLTRFVIRSDITNVITVRTGCWYDVQMTRSDGDDITLVEDRCDINKDVTRAEG